MNERINMLSEQIGFREWLDCRNITNCFGQNHCIDESVFKMPLKALSVRQPWATLSALGIKTLEIRTWATKFRGLYLIHSSGQRDYQANMIMKTDQNVFDKYGDVKTPRASIIAIAELSDCFPMLPEHETASCCRYYNGLFAHAISGVFPIEPIPMKGRLNYFQTELTIGDLSPLSLDKAEKLIAGKNYW